ncbi:MAG: hypothetical protein HY702_04870 [Gemmatimonadetes bacterium]|nr:hypothetical protein [Gemmatimonadota bacterium]
MALVLLSVVLAAVYTLLQGQRRFYAVHADRVLTWDAVRAASEVFGAELRGLNPAAGDLYALARDSVALRGVVGFGVVCGLDEVGGTLLVRSASGSFESQPRDSVLVFVEGSADRPGDDGWRSLRVLAASGAGGRGVVCADSRPAELGVRVEGSVLGVRPGAPVRAFRPYVYRSYRDREGVWWIGRRLRGGTLQPVVGPVRSRDEGGLVFEGVDAHGAPTGVLEEIVMVRVTVRGQSAGAGSSVRDSTATAVFLRNTHYGG